MLPREHPVGDRGEAVNIGPTVDQLPGQGLGGHILEGSDEESRAGEALFRWQLREPYPASRRKRFTAVGSLASRDRNTLNAHVPRCGCWARYTSAVPPSPTRSRRR